MGSELLEIQPCELKFTFELKRQSSCSVQLVNKSKEYVAFKVKTTSPKRYCVRPNTGVILPRSTCSFTVTMQAQKVAPPDMQFKDKFLIQSTIIPYGSADEDIVPSFFLKENGRYIEEKKLRVVLVCPPHSPILRPLNEVLNHEPTETLSAKESLRKDHSPALRETLALRESPLKDQEPSVIEILAARVSPQKDQVPAVCEPITVRGSPLKEAPSVKETHSKDQPPFREVENLPPSYVRDTLQVKEIEDLKLKINDLESKLNEVDNTNVTLKQEKSLAIEEKDKLQQEIVMLRRRCNAQVQAGFPFLFVVFMALVGAVVGYFLHR